MDEKQPLLLVELTKAWSKSARDAAVAARKANRGAMAEHPTTTHELSSEDGVAKAGDAGLGGPKADHDGGSFSSETPYERSDFMEMVSGHSGYGVDTVMEDDPNFKDPQAAAMQLMEDAYKDAMMGVSMIPPTKDADAQSRVESALKEVGFREFDDGYAEGNLHLVSNYDHEEKSFGIDSLTGKVYDVYAGHHLGTLTKGKEVDDLKKIMKKHGLAPIPAEAP